MLRCRLPDRPGALAAVAGAIGEVGGDIQGIEVVETEGGEVLDDLVVVVDAAEGRRVVDAVRALDGVDVVHAGPSRGHPGDAAFRLAVAIEALLSGAMTVDHGVRALVGGLLRASGVTFVGAAEAPTPTATRLVLTFGRDVVVVERDYRFTQHERERAEALLRVCHVAAQLTKAAAGEAPAEGA